MRLNLPHRRTKLDEKSKMPSRAWKSYPAAVDDARAHGGAIPNTVTICDDPNSTEVYKVNASDIER